MHSLTSVLHAWMRIGLFPAVVFLVVAGWRAPLVGWPRQQTAQLLAAWVLLACVPISGLARLGEVDVVLCAGAAWVALGPGGSARQRHLLITTWVAIVVFLMQTCGTLVLTRIPGCSVAQVSVQAGIVLTLLAFVVMVCAWPRQTIPQRMTVVALGALVVEYARQVQGLLP